MGSISNSLRGSVASTAPDLGNASETSNVFFVMVTRPSVSYLESVFIEVTVSCKRYSKQLIGCRLRVIGSLYETGLS